MLLECNLVVWNTEVVVSSLSTSLCMVSGPGALPLLRNLNSLMSVTCTFPPISLACGILISPSQ